MPVDNRIALPEAALQWLVGEDPARIITLGCSRGVVKRLMRSGHEVLAVENDRRHSEQLAREIPSSENFFTVAGRADELPVRPCTAHVILLTGIWRTEPGGPQINAHEAHGQISRALQPGGWAAGWQVVRDDTVPWVRRLTKLMRSIDPDAMSGTHNANHEDLLKSKYFPRVEHRAFRLWTPITRQGMITMVTNQPALRNLAPYARQNLIDQLNSILDNVTRTAEMRLPYEMRCWRAHTDHQELTQPITFNDGGLIIPI